MDRGVTYLKLFLTTTYVDLSYLEKGSLFDCGPMSPQSWECAQDFSESANLAITRATLPSQGIVHRGIITKEEFRKMRMSQTVNLYWTHLFPIVQKRVIRD